MVIYVVCWPILAWLAGRLIPAIGKGDLVLVIQITVQALFVFLIQKLAQFFQDTLFANPALSISQQLRNQLFNKLQRIEIRSLSKLSTGDISSMYGIQDDPRLIQISNPIQPGNSGGPLLNENGEIVGVVVSTLNAKYFYENETIIPQNVNFAIKSNYVTNLISLLPEHKELTTRKNLLLGKSLEEKIELVSPFIVTIK